MDTEYIFVGTVTTKWCASDTGNAPPKKHSLPAEEFVAMLVDYRRRNLTIAETAKRIEVTQKYIRSLEKKKPRDWELRELVDYHLAVTDFKYAIEPTLTQIPKYEDFMD